MKKDFDSWNQQKQRIDKVNNEPHVHHREIWWAHFGANIGGEQNGSGQLFLRLVVVLKIINEKIFFAVPLTTNNRGWSTHLPIDATCLKQKSFALCEQLRPLSNKRLKRKVGFLSKKQFTELRKTSAALFSAASGPEQSRYIDLQKKSESTDKSASGPEQSRYISSKSISQKEDNRQVAQPTVIKKSFFNHD